MSKDEKQMFYTTCGYWTDHWEKLGSTGPGLPCCPVCGMVGFQSSVKSWYKCAKEFQEAGHPRYVEFLDAKKEQCFSYKFHYMDAYKTWLKEQEQVK